MDAEQVAELAQTQEVEWAKFNDLLTLSPTSTTGSSEAAGAYRPLGADPRATAPLAGQIRVLSVRAEGRALRLELAPTDSHGEGPIIAVFDLSRVQPEHFADAPTLLFARVAELVGSPRWRQVTAEPSRTIRLTL